MLLVKIGIFNYLYLPELIQLQEGMVFSMADLSNRDGINDLIIIGSGAAGLTAAIYAGRSELDTLVIKGNQPGGQLTITTEVDNFPGFPEGIEGSSLMKRTRKQAEKFGARFVEGSISDVNFDSSPFSVEVENDTTYRGRSIIVATGASARWLGLESEEKYRGKGVSACATCDGFFFQDEEVLVVGGGDGALEEALFLTKFASRVRILHRRENLRASAALQKRAHKNDKIEIIRNTELIEIVGDGEAVTGARVVSHPDGHPKQKWEEDPAAVEEMELECSGIFIAIGHSPNTELFADYLKLDDEGFLITQDEVFTNIPGVFAAGDVQDKQYRQAITAAGSGCKAALEAERYLGELDVQ